MLHPKILTRKRFCWIVILSSSALAAGGLIAWAGQREMPSLPVGTQVELTSFQDARPSLEGGVGWINTAGPIHLEDLRGKVVLLDFWTYCCINCHHVLPDLAYLEEKYKDELVVIGVHTAKFEAEKDTDNIRKKVAEYRIKHPVINDADQVLWNRFGVSSWPTLVVLDAKGNYVGSISGEGHREALDQFLGKLIAQHKARGEISSTPIRFFPEDERPHEGPLLYPGKVLADAGGQRLFISDTGHNRIVVTDLDGKSPVVIGSGAAGLADGGFDQAKFNRPQGMCLVGGTLYVADTENHAIRAVDLTARQVATVAGNGKQGAIRRGSGEATATSLNSPWDVLAIPGSRTLAIAMAGPHQIWKLDLDAGKVAVWAGSGVENIVDGPLASAAFAQPSGLATDGEFLFVADSEVSGIRAVPLKGGRVQTVVGVGLFGFGDIDGRGAQVRLQHCLGVAYGNGMLYIADSYNNKIKVCNPEAHAVQTFAGTGMDGRKDDPAQFDEPGGLSLAGKTLYVADTNNHAIRKIDIETKKVSTLTLGDVSTPKPTRRPPSFPNAVAIEVPPTQAAPGREINLDVTLNLPQGFKLNPMAPLPYQVETPNQAHALGADAATNGARVEPPALSFSVRIPLAESMSPGQSLTLKLSTAAFICKEGAEGLCTIKSYVWNVPIKFEAGAPSTLALTTPTGSTASR